MREPACCAHLHVSYRTEELPHFGTHGWWACDCGKRFAPISNTAIDGERATPIEGDDLNKRFNESIAHFDELRRRQDQEPQGPVTPIVDATASPTCTTCGEPLTGWWVNRRGEGPQHAKCALPSSDDRRADLVHLRYRDGLAACGFVLSSIGREGGIADSIIPVTCSPCWMAYSLDRWENGQIQALPDLTTASTQEIVDAGGFRSMVEMSREEMKERYPDAPTCPECGYHPGEHGMHRESCETGRMRAYRAHEIAPASWWSRVRRWIR